MDDNDDNEYNEGNISSLSTRWQSVDTSQTSVTEDLKRRRWGTHGNGTCMESGELREYDSKISSGSPVLSRWSHKLSLGDRYKSKEEKTLPMFVFIFIFHFISYYSALSFTVSMRKEIRNSSPRLSATKLSGVSSTSRASPSSAQSAPIGSLSRIGTESSH